ncbi:LysR family transcriptional regulator [Bradyrhizobium sp. 31Argb]|uniref:LysR family transcriptional regulator n=1 Tax=unclassified Bradyrhizobium TaxID=2631580 RepID=UPI00102E5CB0|nr:MULTISPECIES: LysR family transcriptional regulator [unclassified Bradyrhizobium]MDI4235348.1 LysR family transcriptional regulator [Bradyrhizobium sp. Arg237L]TAI64389.1 LysR family transcriptional regulator [Bradyrhizobium sp. Leo170]
MLDFRSIETFLWVVKLGSFRGAAQRLNTTQPAISQRIAQLERELGVKLLNRDHRVASPTPSGRQMMVYAEKLIGLRSEMMAEIGDRSAMRGVLRLGVAETIVHTWLTRLVKSVNEVYPNLSLEIEVDITPNLSARLLAQEIELAFVVGPLSASGVQSRVLCDYPIGFLASPALGLGNGPVARRDLARFPIITFPRKTVPYESVRAVFERPDLPPIRLHASASLATVIHMAIEGLGIAVIPSAIVENELADGRLQLLDTDIKMAPLTFNASWLTSPDIAAVERVADLARQIAQASPSVDEALRARH